MRFQRESQDSLSRASRGRFAATAAAASVVWLMFQAGVARAEVAYWKDINTVWNTANNWSTLAKPSTVGVATFTNNSTYAYPPTPAANTIGGIDVTGSANLTFGAATVVLTLNGVNGIGLYAESTAGAVNFNTTRFTLASAQSWRNDSANLMTINGTAIVNGGFLLTLDGSGTGGITFGSTSVISGSGGLTVDRSGGGVVTLGGANTYTGTTTINAGTLAMSAGSLASTNIVLMSGATFDVSALSGFSVASGRWLGCGSTSGTAIVNATGKTLTLASGALLAFQADGTAATVCKMVVTNNLALNNNVVTVNVQGSTLTPGTYRLMECTGTLTGAAYGDAMMTGMPLSTGCFGFIQTTAGTAGYVDLVVRKAPVFSGGSYDGFDSRSFLNSEIPAKKGTLISFF